MRVYPSRQGWCIAIHYTKTRSWVNVQDEGDHTFSRAMQFQADPGHLEYIITTTESTDRHFGVHRFIQVCNLHSNQGAWCLDRVLLRHFEEDPLAHCFYSLALRVFLLLPMSLSLLLPLDWVTESVLRARRE